jgi:hypothetical protein
MTTYRPLVKTAAKAQARADRQLIDVQEQDVRIKTTITGVLQERVTLVKAGMRIKVKGTHWFPDNDDWHNARVLTAEPRPFGPGRTWDIPLELQLITPGPDGVVAGPPSPGVSTSGAVLWEPGSTFESSPDTHGDITWHGNGDAPSAGYPGPGGGGPIDSAAFAYLGTHPANTGFQVLATSGTLDIYLQLDLADAVAGPTRTYTLRLLLNGSQVASEALPGGPGGVYLFFAINVSGLAVVAGDELTVDMTTSDLSGHSIPAGTGATSNRFQILNTSTVSI